MNDVSRIIAEIAAAAEDVGLPEFARRAEVPYTTLADWKAKGWRPKVVSTFGKLAQAAEEHRSGQQRASA